MRTLIVRKSQKLEGTTGSGGIPDLPGDKSISHRAALFGAMAEGESRFENFLDAGVTRAMLNALSSLGVDWQLDGHRLAVQGRGWKSWQQPEEAIHCGNSATTMRLLTGALAAAGIPAVLTGSEGLCRRPMGRIVEPLQKMGVPIDAAEGGRAPLTLKERSAAERLQGGQIAMAQASAQVKTCLLLAGMDADAPLEILEPMPTRDHSERMLRAMGVQLDVEEGLVRLHPPVKALTALQMRLPGDFSAAAFIMTAALLVPGSAVRIPGVGLNPGRSGLLDTLLEMGADITALSGQEAGGEPVGDLFVHASRLKGVSVRGERVVRMIDEFPSFAVAAAFAEGVSEVRDAGELRLKESDRISTLADQLRRIGIEIEELPDGFRIQGGQTPQGGEVDSCGDHRLAMSLAVAGLAARDAVRVRNAEMVAESFPQFVEMLQALGGDLTWA